jgi:hypothetical protein
MTVDREEASALLADVKGTEDRVHQLLIYSRISHYLFLWGAIWLVGFTATYFYREQSNVIWLVLQPVGFLATVALVARRVARSSGEKSFAIAARAGVSVLSIVLFGTLWVHLTDMAWREQVTFWPTLLSFLLFLFGLWVGRAIALGAIVLFAVSFLGYYVAGDYLHLWMAVVVGGALIAGGFWLRR